MNLGERRRLIAAAIERAGGRLLIYDENDGASHPIGTDSDPSVLERIVKQAYQFDILELGSGRLSDDEFSGIALFSRLSQFYAIFQAPLDDCRMSSLGGLRDLEILSIEDSCISDAGLAALNGMSILSLLDLDSCDISGSGLVCLTDKTKIRHLGLKDNPLGDEGLEHLIQLRQLRGLDLSYTLVTDRGLARLADAGVLESVESLILSGTRITDDGMARLAGLPRLRFLALTGTSIRGPGLAFLASTPTLEGLMLNDTPLEEPSVVLCPAFPNVTSIEMAGTSIGNAGAAWLAHFPKLRHVRLDDTQVGDAGAVALAARPTLWTARLSRSNVGDVGFVALSANASIGLLELEDTFVSDAGLDAAIRAEIRLSLTGSQTTQAGIRRYALRSAKANVGDFLPRPRQPGPSPRPAKLAVLATINKDDTVESLWTRAAILWQAREARRDELRAPLAKRSDVDALFAAAVARSNRPAPILVAWGDSGPGPIATKGLRVEIESRLTGRPEEAAFCGLFDGRNGDEWCYAAAAAIEPSYAPAWERLACYLRANAEVVRAAAEAFVRYDPDNALAYYLLANRQPDSISSDDLIALVEQGNSAPRIDAYATPLPAAAFLPGAQSAIADPDLDGAIVQIKLVGNRAFDGFGAILRWFCGGFVPTGNDVALRRSLARAVARLRDACVAAESAAFVAGEASHFVSSSSDELQQSGALEDEIAKAKSIEDRWHGMAKSYWQAQGRVFVRVGSLLADAKAAQTRLAKELATIIEAHGFDGSLAWLAK